MGRVIQALLDHQERRRRDVSNSLLSFFRDQMREESLTRKIFTPIEIGKEPADGSGH